MCGQHVCFCPSREIYGHDSVYSIIQRRSTTDISFVENNICQCQNISVPVCRKVFQCQNIYVQKFISRESCETGGGVRIILSHKDHCSRYL